MTQYQPDPLLRIDSYLDDGAARTLAEDVRRGLSATPRTLPSKYFYDDYGSRLFDQICDLPEYYPTRTEFALLREAAPAIVELTRPTHLVELGSGTARKTRVLLDHLNGLDRGACYVAMDVGEAMLRRAARALRREYPGLRVHGIAGDYEHHLERIPAGARRLAIFLGGTIGNFTREEAVDFVGTLRRSLAPGDFVLIGMDRVKPADVLHAAYNDSAGVTAEFNRNILRVLNRELGADFALERFEHVAFFDPEASQIEMHLRSDRDQAVSLSSIDLIVPFASGETIRTEISRKFTPTDVHALFEGAGLELVHLYSSPDDYFSLALGVVP